MATMSGRDQGEARKDPVEPSLGGTVPPPSHPPEAGWRSVETLVLVLVLGAVGVAALVGAVALLAVAGHLVGGAAIVIAVAALFVVAGIGLSRLSVSPRFLHGVVSAARNQDMHASPPALARSIRRQRQALGWLLAAAGAIALTYAFADAESVLTSR
jgi:hypothetical protein